MAIHNLVRVVSSRYQRSVMMDLSRSRSPHATPCWHNPVPVDYKYPWHKLSLPNYSTEEDQAAKATATAMKDYGNDSFKRGDYYDALWKYEHACALCRNYSSLKADAAVLHSNIAMVCLKLGDAKKVDLLDTQQYPSTCCHPLYVLWYAFAKCHASKAIKQGSGQKIKQKAFYRRAQSLRKMTDILGAHNTIQTMNRIISDFFPPRIINPYHLVVTDLVHCFKLQEGPDPTFICDALILAVNNGCTSFLPVFQDKHIDCGLTSKLLSEIICHDKSTVSHISYILFKINVDSKRAPNLFYDASKVTPSQLLKKNIEEFKIYQLLIDCGMPVKAEEIVCAVHTLPDSKQDIIKLLVSKCEDPGGLPVYEEAIHVAMERSKKQFVAILAETCFHLLSEEGDISSKKDLHFKALDRYTKALDYTSKYNNKKDKVEGLIKCIDASFTLQMYSDAYTYCTKLVKLDPWNSKVRSYSYFRRADALKGILSGPLDGRPPGTYRDVVSDYVECLKFNRNLDALFNAITVGHKHEITELIPRIVEGDVQSGLSTQLLKKIVGLQDMNESLLKFVVFELPQSGLKNPYDARRVDVTLILSKSSDYKLIERLLTLGMNLKQKQMETVVLRIPPEDTPTFELLLKCATRNKFSQDVITAACVRAMDTLKLEFIPLLIDCGATPPIDRLQNMGPFENITIQRYLSEKTVSESGIRTLPSDTEQREDTDSRSIKKSLKRLNSEAKHYLEDGDHVKALEQYFNSLGVCSAQNLTDDAASIHIECAIILLQRNSYYQAYRHANTCIKFKPFYEAHIIRAEALKKTLQSGKYEVPATLTYEQVIADYLRAHELKADAKAIMEAILVAIDHGHEHMVQNREFPPDICLTMLMETMSMPECKQIHLEFLVNEVWNNVEVSVSAVTLKNLIMEKAITSASLLQWFLDRGLHMSKEDVIMAMTTLTAEQIDLFKLIVAKCKHTDLDELCAVAVNIKRTMFVLNLVEQGASLPCPSSKLLLQALKAKDYNGAMALVKLFKTKGTIDTLNLASLMNNSSEIIKSPDLIKALIKIGVDPNEKGGKTPIAIVMGKNLTPSKTIDIVCLLMDNGEDCSHLCQTSKTRTTPLHVATELALKSGDLRVIDSVLHSRTFNPNQVANDKGESPLHLAVKSHWKKDHSTTVLSALLKSEVLNPSKRNHSGKRPIDCLVSLSDDRASMLKAASHTITPSLPQQKKKPKKQKTKCKTSGTSSSNENLKEPAKSESSLSISSLFEHSSQDQIKQPKYEDFSISKKLEFQIKRLMTEGAQYFQVEMSETASSASVMVSSPVSSEVTLKENENQPSSTNERKVKNHEASSADKKDTVSQHPEVHQKPTNVATEQTMQLSEGFLAILAEHGDIDQLSWEVEGTAKVVKFFKDWKNNSPMIRQLAAKVIYQLAEGKRNTKHLSKQVGNEKSLRLYEARITQAARILWEKAITFSAKLTGPSPIPVYSEVIRVWEIVLDHDNLERSIKQIEKSHRQGSKASLKFTLLSSEPKKVGEMVRGKEELDWPVQFTLSTVKETNSKHSFIPAANMRENDYNVTTFYSFDTINFKSMLLGTDDRRDFPFKEWHKEHEIIMLNSREAILLLGRSGTGKTTCCLYRLWNEFKNFWNPESSTYRWKIPRRRLIPPSVLMLPAEETESKEQAESDESQTSAETEPTLATKQIVSMDNSMAQEDIVGNSLDECDDISISSAIPTSASQAVPLSPKVQVGEDMEIIEEDLHQVFITKNCVLCKQMKNRFYNMAAAFDFLSKHMKHEKTDPHKDLLDLLKVDDCAFPLFLTARQFYILLDNSLCDNQTFFKRDEKGNLKVKIISLDYDDENPDILLDLEQSHSKDDEMEGMSSSTTQSLFKGHTDQWTEVTALYFKEFIWPTISHQCGINSKDFDPLLVWIEIQSFIKGSESALRKGSHLSLQEYKQIGNRMAPNFSSHRDTIYKMFLKYQKYQQNQRHNNYLFDECDLVLQLYNRLKNIPDVPWAIHSLYIDEVQDFTQAELAIFIHCCRDPNSMFFTGDTAQSIMRGIAFRFQDLRSLFHRIHSNTLKVNVPKRPYTLTINFRSHSGILNVAGSIIDLLSEFFKDSIDHLPHEEGMFPGPTPVFLESCEIDDLALLLSSNEREASAIEFGAHQVILVQSKEAKDNLPTILKGAIVLTIFEAKGLEFDDVLLYDFFANSVVDEKAWRVITSYLEMSQHRPKIVNPKLPGSLDDPRSLQFDPKLHKSLNSELKYLYTAVTRAKCNLWIYDSNPKSRLPMFNYWYKRDLIKVVKKEDQVSIASNESQDKYALVFASNSTPEQWKAQGDNFKKKHLWEQAILCYQRAGPENEYLAKESHAYHLIQQARHQKPQLYLEAALGFFECDELHHNLHYLNGAALCLRNSKPPKYHEAAKLFERLNKLDKAAQCYLRGKDIDNYGRLKENAGQHSEVVRALMGKPFMRKRDALAKASEYEKQGIKLHQDLSTSELSYSCAKFYSQRGDKDTLIEVLVYMPETSKRVKFLKEAKLYDNAFEILVDNKEFRSAYRLASAQTLSSEAWLQSGLRVAEENKDETMRASFIFQRAKVEYIKRQVKNHQDILNSEVVEQLHKLLLSKDRLTKAHAYLLLGMLKRKDSHCQKAWGIYHSESHKVGELEAFNQFLKLSFEFDKLQSKMISMCHVAKEVSSTLMRARDINKVVKEAVSFYGLQKIGVYYYTPPGQDIWIGELLAKCVCKSNRTDLDGMLRLDASDARDELAKHCADFKSQWLLRLDPQRKLEPKMTSFLLHKQFKDKNHHLFRSYSMKEVSTEALYQYLQTCLHLLELCILEEGNVHDSIDLLASIFTPRVYFYLPQRIENRHIAMFRESIYCRQSFQQHIKERILIDRSTDRDPFPSRVKVDTWLRAWRASCIFDPDMKSLQEELQSLESTVNKDSTTTGYKHPPGFIFWDSDQKFHHILSLWLKSCTEMRKGNFLWASKLAINHFLGTIAQHANECSLQVMNAVDILSIHCTGLLSVLTHVSALQQRSKSYTVPFFYKSNMYLFSLMNCWNKEDRYLLSACADEVSKSRNLKRLFGQCRQLLIRALDIILGTGKRAPHYSVLSIGLKNIPSSDATKHCLVLALVLFGNLSTFNIREIRDFFQKIQFLLQHFILNKENNVPRYISIAYEATKKATFFNPVEVFNLVRLLLQDAHVDSTLASLVFKAKGHHSKVMIIPVRYQPMISSPPQFPESPVASTSISSSKQYPILQNIISDDTAPVEAVDQNQGLAEPQYEPTWSTVGGPSETTSQNRESVTHEAQYASLHDEDNTELVISPSEYEAGFKFDVTEDTEEEQNQPELEEEQDEDMSLALASGNQYDLSQIDPNLIDPEMINPSYCNACGVSLRSDLQSEPSEPDPELEDEAATRVLELYYTHVTSEIHSINIILYRKLADDKQFYTTLRQSVTSRLQDYKELHHVTNELDQPIDDIQEELEKSDILLAELEEKYSWRNAIDEVSKMQNMLDRFMKNYGEHLSQEIESSKQLKQPQYEAMDSIEDNIESIILGEHDPTDVIAKTRKTKRKL